MNGRRESEIKIENRIMKKLDKLPEIVTDYYYSMTSKTAHTKECYINYIREYLDFIDNEYEGATLLDINRFMEHIRYRKDKNGNVIENGESIRRTKIFAVSNFYDFLVTIGKADANPCDKAELPTLKQDIQVVSMDPTEIKKLRENVVKLESDYQKRARDMAIVSLGITTGLRVSAIAEINMEDLNMDDNSIEVVEKGNVKRTVYFGRNTKKDLEMWLAYRRKMEVPTDALFVSRMNNRISCDVIYDLIRKYTADFDKHITPHKMRSTCATNLYEKTHDIYMVQAVLGHKNIANTRRYANVSIKERKNAAGILDSL